MIEVEPITKLAKRAKEIAAEHGFVLHYWGLSPDLEDDNLPPHVNMSLEYDPDADKTKPEVVVLKADAAIQDAMEEGRREDLRQQAMEARQQLDQDLADEIERNLKGRGGIFGE